MSTFQIQNLHNNCKIIEKCTPPSEVKKRNTKNLKETSGNSAYLDKSKHIIHENIERNLYTKEQSNLLKYLTKKENPSFMLPSGTIKSCKFEKLKGNTYLSKLGGTCEISNWSSAHRTKYNEKCSGETYQLNEYKRVKDKEISLLHSKMPVAFERGDFISRKDFELDAKQKNYSDFCRTERKPTSLDIKNNGNVDKFNYAAYSLNKLSNKDKIENLLWTSEYDTNMNRNSKSKICLPRLVKSDLTERRLKQTPMGVVEAMKMEPRPPPPPRFDIIRRRLAIEIAHPTTASLTSTLATLQHRLRQSSSDAQVALRPCSRRGKRASKPRVDTRASKVRVPRPLSHFLSSGFHPPEPGVSAPRRPRSHLASYRGRPFKELELVCSTASYLVPTPHRSNGYIVASALSGGDGDVHPLDHKTRTPQTARERLNSATMNLRECRRHTAASFSSQLSSKVAPCPAGATLASSSRNILPGTDKDAPKQCTTKTQAPSETIEPLLNLDKHQVSFPSVPSFLMGVKNRRGKPVRQGPSKYRSVPVLKGNLNLTMPSIKEELESEETDIQIDSEEEDKPIVVVFENKNKSKKHRHIKEITQQKEVRNARYWEMDDNSINAQPYSEYATTNKHGDVDSNTNQNLDDKNLKKTERKAQKLIKDKVSMSEGDDMSLKEKTRKNSDKISFKEKEVNEEKKVFQEKTSRKVNAERQMQKINLESMENNEKKQLSERQRQMINVEEQKCSREGGTNSQNQKIFRDNIQERKLTESDERKSVNKRSGKRKKSKMRQSRTKSASTTSIASASAARTNLKELRRGFRKEKKTVAECIAAERVMARWAQANELLRQRETETDTPGRRRRHGSRKHSAKRGDESGGEKKHSDEQSRARMEQLQLTKRAVRQDEMQLLARAERFAE